MAKAIIFLFLLPILMILFSANVKAVDIQLDRCSLLDQNNTLYLLNTSFSNTTAILTCMNITAYNVTFDCQNNYINGSGWFNTSSNRGIWSSTATQRNRNITIQNCYISNFYYGIYFSNVNSSFLKNITYISNGSGGNGASLYNYGIYLDKSSKNSIYNFSANHSGISVNNGLLFPSYSTTSHENNFSNIRVSNFNSDGGSSAGMYFLLSKYNNVSNAFINDNTGGTTGACIEIAQSNYTNFINITCRSNKNGFYINTRSGYNYIYNSSIDTNYSSSPNSQYYLSSTYLPNLFQNTNFSDSRIIRFGYDADKFYYSNDTSNLTIELNLSSTGYIHILNIKNWNNTNISLNISTPNIKTIRINVSYLLPFSYYSFSNSSNIIFLGLSDINGVLSTNIFSSINNTPSLISIYKINDPISPTYTNFVSNTSNNTQVNTNQPINISAQWNDISPLDKCVNSTKDSYHDWINGTWVSNGTDGWANFTLNAPSSMANIFLVKIYCNDTFGNMNVTGTYQFINISTPLPPYSGSSQIIDVSSYMSSYCENNSTIRHNATYNNESVEVIENCNYGCDTITNTCNPNPTYSALLTLGIIFLIILVGYILYKVFR